MALSAAKMVCDVFFLGLVVWREARGASHEAQVAVASSVMNRVKRPSWWGTDVSSVAGKRWQYSSLAAPGDAQLTLWPLLSDPTWLACLGVAYDVIHSEEPNPLPGADSYYDDSIAPPKWTKGARLCGKIDNLNFYDVDNDWEAEAMVATVPGASDFDAKLRAFLEG
jgi:spore germination cell wall hydrolase CwlJ-like protein